MTYNLIRYCIYFFGFSFLPSAMTLKSLLDHTLLYSKEFCKSTHTQTHTHRHTQQPLELSLVPMLKPYTTSYRPKESYMFYWFIST